jgi:hypothetical protein
MGHHQLADIEVLDLYNVALFVLCGYAVLMELLLLIILFCISPTAAAVVLGGAVVFGFIQGLLS